MELPDDVLQIIKEFSQPVTRPDWRSLHRMPTVSFHMLAAQAINRTFPRSVFEMVTQTDSAFKYNLIYDNGFPYIDYIYVPIGFTETGWPIYFRPVYVPI
jgi:hypothetical protein